MFYFALIALFGWLPIIVVLFTAMRPHRAVIAAFLISTLFIPKLQIPLPGAPDYTINTATSLGVLLGSMLFDTGRLFRYRLRWYDAPVACWCVSPMISSLLNDLGIYDGLSVMLEACWFWGIPYWIGRTYLRSTEAFRDLAIGIIIGGIVYVPFCLFEIRFSPMLNVRIYGFMAGPQPWEGMRYGGYRPRVFMRHGLELGMYYTVTMMVAYRCWSRGVFRTLGGYPFGAIVVGLGLITLLCKSTGAMLLLAVGLGILWAAQMTRRTWPVWVLILTPFLYVSVRATNIWSGQAAIEFVGNYLGPDRAHSIHVRFENEVLLAARAHERPIFGWGGFGRSRVFDRTGKDIVITDGWWIISLGHNGYFGLGSLFAIHVVPILVLLRRHPVETWDDPKLVPVLAMSVTVGLYAVDSLSNAMPTLIIPLIAGGIVTLPATLPGRARSPAWSRREDGDRLAAEGRAREAASTYREAIAAAPTLALDDDAYRELATTHARLADALEACGSTEEADEARDAALSIREMMADDPAADAADRRALAEALEDRARALSARGRDAEAEAARLRAVARWAELAPGSRHDYDRWVLALNDLAWLLATSADPETRDAGRAVLMAGRAAREAPGLASCWNTLGVARYRAGDDRGAVEALERSIRLGPPGGTAFDLLVLAMARHRLGDDAGAHDALARGEAWADRHRPGHPGLARLRREARDLLAGTVGQPSLARP